MRRFTSTTIPRRARGFTLIEILVVVAILASLFGLVMVTAGTFIGRAAEKASVSMVLRLQSWLDEYRSLTGRFPPDGIDGGIDGKAVKSDEAATVLRGSAALQYALSTTVLAEEVIGSRARLREHPAVARFAGRELSNENGDYPEAREIMDGWGLPMHYDNTSNKKFQPQDGSEHFPPTDDDHPEDPREGNYAVDDKKVIRRIGNQGRGYDVWSHGDMDHFADSEVAMPVASWNIKTFN